MATDLHISYPDTLPDALRQIREAFEQDAKMAMAAKLYELGRLPLSVAP